MVKVTVIMFLVFMGVLPAQDSNDYLRDYIRIGIRQNLELQGAKENVNTYEARKSQALSLYLPRIELNSRYSRAGGGRSFVFPLGDMMNPLYQIAGLPQRFNNENISFIRLEEQDTKIELIQPIFNAAVYFNHQAQSSQLESANFDYKTRELNIAEKIIEQYFAYSKAQRLLEIRKFASTLIAENHKVASKLFEVGKAPKTDVLRAEVQLSSARQEIMSAENLVNLTKHAFNQTLNRDSQSEIKSENSPINDMIKPEFRKSLEFEGNTETLTVTALNNRPELSQLESGINAVNSFRKATVSDYLPSLTLVADYGIQGEKYQFDDQSRYWMVSGIFKWNLFSGFETSAKSQEMQAQINSLQKSSESLKQLINLEIQNNYYNYKNSYDQYDVAVKSYLSANENYDLNKKRYEEGLNPFISLLDAETTLKLTMENLYMTYYDVLTAKWKLNKSIGNLFK